MPYRYKNVSPLHFGENCGRISGRRTTPTSSTVPETCPVCRLLGSTFFLGTHPRFTRIVPLLDIWGYSWKYSLLSLNIYRYKCTHSLPSNWKGVITKKPIDESCFVIKPPFCSSALFVTNERGPIISSRSCKNLPRTLTNSYSMSFKSWRL